MPFKKENNFFTARKQIPHHIISRHSDNQCAMPRRPKNGWSQLQKAQLASVHIGLMNQHSMEKENAKTVTHQASHGKVIDPLQAATKCKGMLANMQRKNRHLRKQRDKLKEINVGARNEAERQTKKVQVLEKEAGNVKKIVLDLCTQLNLEKEDHKKGLRESAEGVSKLRGEIRRLKKKVSWRTAVKDWLMAKAKATPVMFKLLHGRTYSPEARKLSRQLVLSGCARSKVGPLIKCIGNLIGAKMKRTMGARTVGHTMMEGYVAAKGQMGYEISRAKGTYFS